jgi:hypothetical protein
MTDMDSDPSKSIPVAQGMLIIDSAELSQVDNTLETIVLDKNEEKDDADEVKVTVRNDTLADTPLKPPAMTATNAETASPSAVVASEIEASTEKDEKEVEI